MTKVSIMVLTMLTKINVCEINQRGVTYYSSFPYQWPGNKAACEVHVRCMCKGLFVLLLQQQYTIVYEL